MMNQRTAHSQGIKASSNLISEMFVHRGSIHSNMELFGGTTSALSYQRFAP
jgi:hypothetical protein